jgi:hypothetical protein
MKQEYLPEISEKSPRCMQEYSVRRHEEKENRKKKILKLGSNYVTKKQMKEVFMDRDDIHDPKILMDILKTGRM